MALDRYGHHIQALRVERLDRHIARTDTFDILLERYKRSGWKHVIDKWVRSGGPWPRVLGEDKVEYDIRHLCEKIGFIFRPTNTCSECNTPVPAIIQLDRRLKKY